MAGSHLQDEEDILQTGKNLEFRILPVMIYWLGYSEVGMSPSLLVSFRV